MTTTHPADQSVNEILALLVAPAPSVPNIHAPGHPGHFTSEQMYEFAREAIITTLRDRAALAAAPVSEPAKPVAWWIEKAEPSLAHPSGSALSACGSLERTCWLCGAASKRDSHPLLSPVWWADIAASMASSIPIGLSFRMLCANAHE